MKVKELIKILKALPQDKDVVFESCDEDYGSFYCDVEEAYELTVEYRIRGDYVPVEKSGKMVTRDVVMINGTICE